LSLSAARLDALLQVDDAPFLRRSLLLLRDATGSLHLRQYTRGFTHSPTFATETLCAPEATSSLLASAAFTAVDTLEFINETRLVLQFPDRIEVRKIRAGRDCGSVAVSARPIASGRVCAASWDPEGCDLAVSSSPSKVEFFRLERGSERHIGGLAKSPHGRVVFATVRGTMHMVESGQRLVWSTVEEGRVTSRQFGPFAHRCRGAQLDRAQARVRALFDAGPGSRSVVAAQLHLRTGSFHSTTFSLDDVDADPVDVVLGYKKGLSFLVVQTESGQIYRVDRRGCSAIPVRRAPPSFLFASTQGPPCFGVSTTARGIELFKLDGTPVW
jgi:hypothetical protein